MGGYEKDIEKLRSMIEASTRGVVFTGAGISTESGIPDFRSPGGIWTKYQPINFKDFMASEEMRRESWRRKFASDAVMKKAQPNTGHLAVAKLVQKGKVSSVVTQNVDGLHQLSGVPEDKVIELHGNATYAACLDCAKRYELEEIRVVFEKDETLPVCDQCSGIIKTATISFGQAMPVSEMQAAEAETMACDLFLAIGSSLVVYPAAGFPELAKRKGSRLVILNRDPTPLDEIADLVLHTEIGPTLSAAVELD
ncbi:MAG: Sir2 family NAD-dependent protein deacetylase [Desulfobacterales bacterium]|nr:MAG: Sir2 family NAD-dependent protein deacetylase [Desulfobacterales bacterium]